MNLLNGMPKHTFKLIDKGKYSQFLRYEKFAELDPSGIQKVHFSTK